MSKDAILYGIIGLLAGSLFTILVARNAVNNNMEGMMRMMGMNQKVENMMEEVSEHRMMGMGSSMDEMTKSLEGKTGDDFDKAFIAAMIIHHQGAINMADETKVNTKHDEIKKLADDIIFAQTKEIEMMRSWQKTWGY